MTIWIDAQLSPAIAGWFVEQFGITAIPVRDLGLRDARDQAIFEAAGRADAVVLTKDADFAHLLRRHGPPPRVLWLTCGNTSNAGLRGILTRAFPEAMAHLDSGESLVQISGSAVE